jgi:hypothetical protein
MKHRMEANRSHSYPALFLCFIRIGAHRNGEWIIEDKLRCLEPHIMFAKVLAILCLVPLEVQTSTFLL